MIKENAWKACIVAQVSWLKALVSNKNILHSSFKVVLGSHWTTLERKKWHIFASIGEGGKQS